MWFFNKKENNEKEKVPPVYKGTLTIFYNTSSTSTNHRLYYDTFHGLSSKEEALKQLEELFSEFISWFENEPDSEIIKLNFDNGSDVLLRKYITGYTLHINEVK